MSSVLTELSILFWWQGFLWCQVCFGNQEQQFQVKDYFNNFQGPEGSFLPERMSAGMDSMSTHLFCCFKSEKTLDQLQVSNTKEQQNDHSHTSCYINFIYYIIGHALYCFQQQKGNMPLYFHEESFYSVSTFSKFLL